MSSLLLQGWKMTAECCQDCGVPLMQHPIEGHTLCVNCDQRSDGQPTANGASDAGARLGGAASAAGAASVVAAASGTNVEDGTTDEEDGEQQQRDAGDSFDAAQFRRQQQQSDRTSAALAERMLLGWALLDKYCPRCATPLVRSRQATTYCVTCDCQVIDQAQQQRQQANGAMQQESVSQAVASMAQHAVGSMALPSSAPAAQSLRAQHQVASAAGNLVTAASAATGHNSAPPQVQPTTTLTAPAPAETMLAPPKEPSDMQLAALPTQRELPVLEELLLRKLHEVEWSLDSTPASQVDKCEQYLGLINKLIDTLGRVKKL